MPSCCGIGRLCQPDKWRTPNHSRPASPSIRGSARPDSKSGCGVSALAEPTPGFKVRLRLEPVETRAVGINGLRERARDGTEVFMIPQITDFGGAGDTEVRQGN